MLLFVQVIQSFLRKSWIKGIPESKINFKPLKRKNILRHISFSKIIMDFSFTFFLLFSTLKKSPPGQGEVRQGSRKSVSGVKEKCVRGQGEVHRGLRRSASAECVIFNWSTSRWPLTHFSLTPANFSLTPDALLLDLEGLFFKVEKENK